LHGGVCSKGFGPTCIGGDPGRAAPRPAAAAAGDTRDLGRPAGFRVTRNNPGGDHPSAGGGRVAERAGRSALAKPASRIVGVLENMSGIGAAGRPQQQSVARGAASRSPTGCLAQWRRLTASLGQDPVGPALSPPGEPDMTSVAPAAPDSPGARSLRKHVADGHVLASRRGLAGNKSRGDWTQLDAGIQVAYDVERPRPGGGCHPRAVEHRRHRWRGRLG